jgi:hypothetical protein
MRWRATAGGESLGLACLLLACAPQARPTTGDADTFHDAGVDGAAGTEELPVRVPAALRIARGLDSLSVGVDAASLALTQVAVDRGMTVGVERNVFVFPEGQARPAEGRRGVASGPDFDAATDTWTTKDSGIPVPGTKYVAEVELVLFETDVRPGQARPPLSWDPRAGRYKALWSRTLRQAEE